MSGGIDPGNAHLRALQLWDENGFDELSVGLVSCVMGGDLLLGDWVSTARFLGGNSPFVMPFLMLLTLTVALTIKKALARLVYPRTGYVVFRPALPRKWIFLSFLALGAVLTIAEQLRGSTMHLSRVWGPAYGLLFAACCAWGAITYGMWRYLWIAGLSLALGSATFAAGAKGEGVIWVMLGTGVALVLEGALRMKRFLTTHPVVEDYYG